VFPFSLFDSEIFVRNQPNKAPKTKKQKFMKYLFFKSKSVLCFIAESMFLLVSLFDKYFSIPIFLISSILLVWLNCKGLLFGFIMLFRSKKLKAFFFN
jgi:hypothetical protein